MKKNAKKWIAAALATVATVSLTACGGSADTQEATADSGETTVVKVGVVGEYNAQWDTINELLADDGSGTGEIHRLRSTQPCPE